MEDNGSNQTQEAPRETAPVTPSGISFPTVGEQKKSSGAKTLLIVGILILVGVLGFVIYKTASSKSEALAEPTPFDNLLSATDQTVVPSTPVPVATPLAADKSKVKIQVQNGTGITGEAAYLQTQLKGLGYTEVSVGNSPSVVSTTEVTFSDSLSSSIVSELKLKLTALYQNVTTTTSASPVYDVVIVTGLRKGATPKPSASASATPTATPKVSPTPTPTSL